MRQAAFSLVPMLAAAILVMVGGLRVARVTEETRTPLDRNRTLDFDGRLRGELERLSDLYVAHLEDAASKITRSGGRRLSMEPQDLAGLAGIQLIDSSGKIVALTPTGLGTKLPELVLGDNKQPFNPEFTVTLDPSLMEKLPENRWLDTPAENIRLYLTRPLPDHLAVLFVDIRTVWLITDQYLESWLEEPIKPLAESGERCRIISPTERTLATSGPERHGPAALSLPVRTDIGIWRTDGWDGIAVETGYDARTLITSGFISLLLALAGLFIFIQQRRAIKLAAERVSFVNRVSHELGTPLTNIALNLDLARDHILDPPPAAKQRLDHVNEEIQRLSRLVANVLTFSRRERDTIKIHPQSCVPDKVIADTLESFRPALARRGIEIECQLDAGDAAWLDPDALAQITGNLISNVEKYGASGKWIRIQTHMDGGKLSMEVHDRGPGIPANSRKRVFRAFERVHRGTNEGSSGTGLGLTIALELATRMGGSLELMDSGKGCAFILTVPAPQPKQAAEPQES